MSVCRRNQGGIWIGCGETDEWFLRCGIPHIRFFQTMEVLFNINKSRNIIFIGQKMVNLFLKRKDFESLHIFAEEFSEFWNKFIPSNLTKNDYKKTA